MNGVRFGEKHSYDDFGLILSSKDYTPPKPKTEMVNIPGRNGYLDLTEALGVPVTFENGKWVFTFTLMNSNSTWVNVLNDLVNYIHGKKMRIILDEDNGFFYYGRCSINQYKSSKSLGTITIECDVDPFKTKI